MESEKYPRTPHLPWSPGGTNDDKRIDTIDGFLNNRIIITEKLDGSNVCLESDACYSRSHSGPPTHDSFDQFKALHASLRWSLPDYAQIFGEWCFALHSIKYSALSHYLNIFAIREKEKKFWYSWDNVQEIADTLGIPTVPVIFDGVVSSEKELKELTEDLAYHTSVYGDTREGLVIRLHESFDDNKFSKSISKWVRANHVQTTEHWKDQEITKNELKK